MANPRGRPKKQELMENDSQTQELRRLVQQRRSHRALAFRAKIILQCASGKSNVAIAQQLKTTGFTAGFWRQRFMVGGVENLFDEPRPGAPRKIGDEDVESVVELTLESTPKAAAHLEHPCVSGKIGFESVGHQSHLEGPRPAPPSAARPFSSPAMHFWRRKCATSRG